MASTDVSGPPVDRTSSLINNPRFRGLFYQVALILVVGWIGYDIYSNALDNLRRLNLVPGDGFLDRTAGFGIIQSLIDYSEASSYRRALFVGLINTLLVAVLGIVFATLLGFLIGIARLSRNWLIAKIAAAYVEIFRNTPLLLQIFFWYFAVLRSVPDMRSKWSLFGIAHLNIGGVYLPRPVFGPDAGLIGIALLGGVAVSIIVSSWAASRREELGRPPRVWPVHLALIVGLPVLVFFLVGRPISFSMPVFNETGPLLRRGFERGSGLVVIPELVGLLLALTIYTAAYIAEIVRAGIRAVSHGQTEAASSLGLRPGQTLRLVVVPQAMRVIIPPLTNQFLNLTKNSSLAVAIAYPDLVSVGGTVLNQTGRAVEIVGVWMAVYLGLSVLTSIIMNAFNRRVALVER
ncbi:amino acid ABC transporter permease [Prosthecomicrobium pneumaticum]|uniref:amino acid ABC transporter permease n=1 Tax=Prosthecomicrobium pneumaticum TaxID=81895 RepID=UPI00161FBACA|nr:amino acid ABC transporter permease [Prosthecomicrobium pneumaticum]